MDLDRIITLIAARCSDALSPDELSEIEARLAERPVVMLDDQTAEKLVAALDQLETRVGQTLANATAAHEAAQAADQVREAWDSFIDSADISTTWN